MTFWEHLMFARIKKWEIINICKSSRIAAMERKPCNGSSLPSAVSIRCRPKEKSTAWFVPSHGFPKIMLILSARDNPDILATAKKIGPAIIFERIWKELAIGKIIRDLLKDRKFEFNVREPSFYCFASPVRIRLRSLLRSMEKRSAH